LRCWVGRWLRCWMGENWTAGREKVGVTTTLLAGRGLRGTEVRDSCAAGWKRWATAALLVETTLGGRVLDCWAGEERCVNCWAGEGWVDCCAAGWETTTLLGKREVDDGGTARLDVGGCAAGRRAVLLAGRGFLRCWVGQRCEIVALRDGRGGRQLPNARRKRQC